MEFTGPARMRAREVRDLSSGSVVTIEERTLQMNAKMFPVALACAGLIVCRVAAQPLPQAPVSQYHARAGNAVPEDSLAGDSPSSRRSTATDVAVRIARKAESPAALS